MPFTGSDICKSNLCSSLVGVLLTGIPPHSFAIILPPVGVFLERGCGADLIINIVLTCLGYIPGIIHALYIILKY
ncbi:hypothetical protein FOMPIDRAFT_1044587 [Fomitopsis schrenkii]|uniref:Uncharacterized protein n=1 Tax=Fomitopsis schrenkii TaxID=2126942 RepID=S8ETA7_FOMSC|nr:hypothetical protein FOMPIDRAFT_1044587 [Fomitopsis schrenkii]